VAFDGVPTNRAVQENMKSHKKIPALSERGFVIRFMQTPGA
jgi:hypothetical protein